MIETISHQEYYDETPPPLRYHHRKRQRQPGILRPTSHSSRRYVPCSLVLFGVPITVKTIFFGIIQISLPVSMCRMGYALELTFGDWILRVLMIFTLTLVLLLLLVDSTLSAGTNKNSGCRLLTTPAERKRKRRVLPPRMSSSSLNASPYPKLVSFAKGTKFFRLPRPKSKRQILKEQQELQQLREVETTTTTTPNNRRYPTLAGMTPPPPRVAEQESLPDWKRAHRLLRAAMRQDPPAWKHDERDAMSVGSKNHDEREDDSSTFLAKNLFCEPQGDGFDADSERDDDDTGDNWSAHSKSMVEDFEDDEYFNQQHHKSHALGIIDDDDDESIILFEDDDGDDTYNQTIMLGTHTCYSPLGASEGSSSLENELEEALEETIEHLSPTRLSI